MLQPFGRHYDHLLDAGLLDALALEQDVGRIFDAAPDLLLALFPAPQRRLSIGHENSVIGVAIGILLNYFVYKCASLRICVTKKSTTIWRRVD